MNRSACLSLPTSHLLLLSQWTNSKETEASLFMYQRAMLEVSAVFHLKFNTACLLQMWLLAWCGLAVCVSWERGTTLATMLAYEHVQTLLLSFSIPFEWKQWYSKPLIDCVKIHNQLATRYGFIIAFVASQRLKCYIPFKGELKSYSINIFNLQLQFAAVCVHVFVCTWGTWVFGIDEWTS